MRLPMLAAAALAAALLAGEGIAPAQPIGSVAVKDYDLGVRSFRQPGLKGRLANMPIRLWGTIAVPASGGPHPVVVVLHGAHGDNCAVVMDADTWPCWKSENRSDLGFRSLVRALAAAGFVAMAPDVNAARSGGWGEGGPRQSLRIKQVVNTTLSEIDRANGGGSTRFGLPLKGKADTARIGVLGHSQGGRDALGWAKGNSHVRSLFLLAPAYDRAQVIPNVRTTVLLGGCDADTGTQGARYVTAARWSSRSALVFQLSLAGANHNYYNQTLATRKEDDAAGSSRPGCADGKRLGASAQQAFLARTASDHFRVSLLGAPAVRWMQTPAPTTIHGQPVTITAVRPK